MTETRLVNGGPWWSRLSIAALAILSLVYLGERTGGRYIDLLETDLREQRRISKDISMSLLKAADHAERRNLLLEGSLEARKELNRTQQRLLEVQGKQCP